MQVELVMPDAEVVRTHYRKLIWLAARTCYSKETPQQLWQKALDGKVSEKAMLRTIRHVVSSGHHSVLEHLNFTFAVSGVSRVTTHQLARHRHISLSQQSQRYVDENFSFVLPSTLSKDARLKEMTESFVAGYAALREALRQAGVEAEDVRYALPQGAATNFLMTANLRALVDICKLRLCTLAQWEIRQLFKQIRKLLGRIDPLYYELLTIKCVWNGYCDEERNKDGHCKIRPYRPGRLMANETEGTETL